MMNKATVLVFLVGIVAFESVSCLKCFVGSGNSSAVLPMTEEEMMEHEKTQGETKPEFKIMECGTRNSELLSIDKLIKNVTDQIQEGLSGLANKADKALSGGDRRRRAAEEGDAEAEEESKYACAKVLMPGKAHRSCVPKVGTMKLDCNSAIGQLAICYCHGDNCNGAIHGVQRLTWGVMAAAAMAGVIVWN